MIGLRYYRALAFFIILGAAAALASAQVDQGELEQNLPPVTFINYEGPHARIETREQIRQIGVGLGRAIRSGAEQAGASNRYFVIHSVSAPDGRKLDADIFGLGVDTGVDHVRNLRTIIQGYLQEAYGYAARDAALLAEYVTIYNAVYRGDWEYFSGKYKTPVTGHINPEQVGISIRFDEWPGRTLMLIPLGIGGLSAIDTSSISDGRVVEEMRKEDDMGVEQRRDMVELKEREAAEAEQKAAAERETVRQEERRIAEERERIAGERQQLAGEQQQIAGEREDAAADEAAQEELDKREAEAVRKTEELDEREAELDERAEALEVHREEAQKQEAFAEEKMAEAREDRETIAQDQQKLIDQGETIAQQQPAAQEESPQGLIGATLANAAAVLGKIVSIHPATGRTLKTSALDTVSVRTITVVNGRAFAIAGENRGNGAVRLIEIDGRLLEMAKQGNDDIHPGSLIWVNGGDLFAITANLDDGSLNLARFNMELVLQAKSKITVHPNATVSIQQGSLLTQRTDGSAAALNPADLSEKGR
jgi:hypothetical protein